MYLTRDRIFTKKEPTDDPNKIYIICEGSEKELNYFQYFEGVSNNLSLIVIPSVDGKTDPIKLQQQAELLFFGDDEEGRAPKYRLSLVDGDQVCFVIDTDRWNKGDKIEKLRQFCESQDQISAHWRVCQSNPVLNFGYTTTI